MVWYSRDSVPLLQQEEKKKFGPEKVSIGKQRKLTLNKTETKRRVYLEEVTVRVGLSVTFHTRARKPGTRRRGIHDTRVFNKQQGNTSREYRNGRHSKTDKRQLNGLDLKYTDN